MRLKRILKSRTFGIALSIMTLSCAVLFASYAIANGFKLPGDDAADKMKATGTMLKLVDTAVFVWGARLLCGFFIFGALWAFKDQRIGYGVICIACAAACAATPSIVKNLFEVNGNNSGVLGRRESEKFVAYQQHREAAKGSVTQLEWVLHAGL